MSDKKGRYPGRGTVLGFREGRDAAAGMKALRIQAGLTQKELAERLGGHIQWVRQRELGSFRLTKAEAEKIAAGLGTDYAGLLAAGAR